MASIRSLSCALLLALAVGFMLLEVVVGRGFQPDPKAKLPAKALLRQPPPPSKAIAIKGSLDIVAQQSNVDVAKLKIQPMDDRSRELLIELDDILTRELVEKGAPTLVNGIVYST